MSPERLSAVVSLAIQAFEEVERVELLLSRKENQLKNAVAVMASNPHVSDADKAIYVEETEAIARRYAEKRAKEGL